MYDQISRWVSERKYDFPRKVRCTYTYFHCSYGNNGSKSISETKILFVPIEAIVWRRYEWILPEAKTKFFELFDEKPLFRYGEDRSFKVCSWSQMFSFLLLIIIDEKYFYHSILFAGRFNQRNYVLLHNLHIVLLHIKLYILYEVIWNYVWFSFKLAILTYVTF